MSACGDYSADRDVLGYCDCGEPKAKHSAEAILGAAQFGYADPDAAIAAQDKLRAWPQADNE